MTHTAIMGGLDGITPQQTNNGNTIHAEVCSTLIESNTALLDTLDDSTKLPLDIGTDISHHTVETLRNYSSSELNIFTSDDLIIQNGQIRSGSINTKLAESKELSIGNNTDISEGIDIEQHISEKGIILLNGKELHVPVKKIITMSDLVIKDRDGVIVGQHKSDIETA